MESGDSEAKLLTTSGKLTQKNSKTKEQRTVRRGKGKGVPGGVVVGRGVGVLFDEGPRFTTTLRSPDPYG